MSRSLGVVVPVYNGSALLPRYLPSVLQSMEQYGGASLVVVDDASQDDSLQLAARLAPGAVIVAREKNGGFGEAVNEGVEALETDLVAVCMTDMELEPQTLQKAAALFEHAEVFAVDFNLKGDSAGNGGVTRLPFSRGYFHTSFPDAEQPGSVPDRIHAIAFAVGGAMLVRRSMFVELGGFDPAYAPFNWEDVDLGWRAWRRGWKSLNHPRAVAWHHHPHLTVNSNSRREFVQTVLWRNRTYFVLKNARQSSTLLKHLFWRTLILARRKAAGDHTMPDGVREALRLVRERVSQPLPEPGLSVAHTIRLMERPCVWEGR